MRATYMQCSLQHEEGETGNEARRLRVPHQFPDASVVSHDPTCPLELGHIGDGLCRQTLELSVGRLQNLY